MRHKHLPLKYETQNNNNNNNNNNKYKKLNNEHCEKRRIAISMTITIEFFES